jgi:hypothetical protein
MARHGLYRQDPDHEPYIDDPSWDSWDTFVDLLDDIACDVLDDVVTE